MRKYLACYQHCVSDTDMRGLRSYEAFESYVEDCAARSLGVRAMEKANVETRVDFDEGYTAIRFEVVIMSPQELRDALRKEYDRGVADERLDAALYL